jgi:restriction system protein
MPVELVLILVVLGVAAWIVYAVVKAALDTTRAAHKGIAGALARARAARFQKKKERLQAFVQINIPAELERTARTIAKFEAAFADRQSASKWVAHRPTWQNVTFRAFAAPKQNTQSTEMNVGELQVILRPNAEPWHEKESRMLGRNCLYPSQPPSSSQRAEPEAFTLPEISMESAVFKPSLPNMSEKDLDRFFGNERRGVEQYNEKRRLLLSKYQDLANSVEAWNESERQQWKRYRDSCNAFEREELARLQEAARSYELECIAENTRLRGILDGFRAGHRQQLLERLDYILGSIEWPLSMSRVWQADYDEAQHILIVEIELPNVVHRPPIKFVEQRIGLVAKPLNQTERRELIPQIHPAIMLRAALEIFRNDESSVVQLLALNGWVSFHHPHTGLDTRAYTAALLVEREQIVSLNLNRIDPLAAFQALKGKSAGKLIEIIPTEPVLNMKRTDSRFVDAKDVLDSLGANTNLAAMDWQDFEHLIRELFEKEFSGRGTEVKITQTSRDRGVDAIVFNPDPIHGGKYIIQAKRYTNTVDVSAVRDLCAVVRKEGASRGILVTTSTYGVDAYTFANNEPITLLDGAQLLGLLQKHGYQFRVDLAEARRMKAEQTDL